MSIKDLSSNARILVVDDEPDLRTLYELTLLRAGYRVEIAGTLAEARRILGEQVFDVLITDMRLPDGLGISLLRGIREQGRHERCVIITAYGSAENAVESLKAGAFDYLTKPVDLKQFRLVIASAVRDVNPTSQNTMDPCLRTGAKAPTLRLTTAQVSLQRMVGESFSMRQVKERIAKVARSMAPVLIHGESGTGKELAAGALHGNSQRADGPLVAVNCSAIPENLLEAEFFGAKKGSYTGATQDRDGFFQAARGGTLFLDEIGDLPLAMQSKLLRAIQERSVRAIGATQEETVDVRIVSATHKDLAAEVEAGRFRQDLYYRLNVIEIHIPPLRERLDDLPALCIALLNRIADEAGIDVPVLSPVLLAQVSRHPLRGNVRELENLLHRAVALGDTEQLQISEEVRPVSHPDRQPAKPPGPDDESDTIPRDLQQHLDQQEREILVKALEDAGYNRTAAASRLGLSLRQMRYRIARLKIDMPQGADAIEDSKQSG
jgi:two-component system, NtrC family, response regulator PilR